MGCNQSTGLVSLLPSSSSSSASSSPKSSPRSSSKPINMDVRRKKSRSEERPRQKLKSMSALNGDCDLGLMPDKSALETYLKSNKLFTDQHFPPKNSSLAVDPSIFKEEIEWIRPHMLSNKPALYVDGASRRDVIQGDLGDCWLLSTCAAVAKRPDLLHRVLDPQQILDKNDADYRGFIKVRLYRFGEWHDVYVDDYLPVYRSSKQFCFAKSSCVDEFWPCFIEKALAKLHGSYEAIAGGMPMEAMVDLTGGLAERYALNEIREMKRLYLFLKSSFKATSLITCSRKGDWRRAHASDQNGLVEGHAYTITGLYSVNINEEEKEDKDNNKDRKSKIGLIRVRNPWGDNNEWRGAWSDGDSHWSHVSRSTRKHMGLHHKHDGEFWMDFCKDFSKQFEEISICTLGPDFDHDGNIDPIQDLHSLRGQWIPGISAGGCRNDVYSFVTNPQYRIVVGNNSNESSDDLNDLINEKSLKRNHHHQVILALAQEHRRSFADRRVKLLQIGFSIFKGSHKITANDLLNEDNDRLIGSSGPYINYREILKRFELRPGNYIMVPATFLPNCASRFLIRGFANTDLDISLLE